VRITIDKDVKVVMRDGTELSTNIYRPDTRDPLPALVQRMPYNKERLSTAWRYMHIERAATRGYAVVVQDVRGRFGSQGSFTPFAHEAEDGFDCVEWVAAQPWCSGTVGTYGGSYQGMSQWLAASRAPASLRAMAPHTATADVYREWIYRGGAFALGSLLKWALGYLGGGEVARREAAGLDQSGPRKTLLELEDDLDTSVYRRTPLTDMPDMREISGYYFDWLEHPDDDGFWAPMIASDRYDRIEVPGLHIGGWYDTFQPATFYGFEAMRTRAANDDARRHQRLVVGPWAHGAQSGMFLEHNFGRLANDEIFDLDGLQLAYFDRWLRAIDDGGDAKPVRLFVMGRDEWSDEEDWPLPGTEYVPFYLHGNGQANTLRGDGALTTDPPGDERDDCFVYDPRNPVPTLGGQNTLPGLFEAMRGPRDQRTIEQRADVLCYSTEPLERALEVIGHIRLVLYASSSAPDTDFTGKLVDVFPDGRAVILTQGILRARYRESRSQPSSLRPGQVYELELDLSATANLFKAGHRIRLEISSSNFPCYNRNSNTGGDIATELESDFLRAINHIHHSSAHPSRLILPVIER